MLQRADIRQRADMPQRADMRQRADMPHLFSSIFFVKKELLISLFINDILNFFSHFDLIDDESKSDQMLNTTVSTVYSTPYCVFACDFSDK